MNTNRNDDKLDELISGAIGRDKPKFNFDKWKHEHEKEIGIFELQTTSGEVLRSAKQIRI